MRILSLAPWSRHKEVSRFPKVKKTSNFSARKGYALWIDHGSVHSSVHSVFADRYLLLPWLARDHRSSWWSVTRLPTPHQLRKLPGHLPRSSLCWATSWTPTFCSTPGKEELETKGDQCHILRTCVSSAFAFSTAVSNSIWIPKHQMKKGEGTGCFV